MHRLTLDLNGLHNVLLKLEQFWPKSVQIISNTNHEHKTKQK